MWSSGTLWTTTVDRCTPAGSATPRSCLRLLAFRAPDPPATSAATHDFDIGDATMDYFAPAVATDHYGDIVIAASESNSVTDPTVDLFSRGTDNALHTRHFNGSTWTGWTSLGGSLASGPAAAIPQTQTGPTTSVPWGTEVIAIGPDQHLWADLKPAGGNWTGWHYLYSQATP